MFSVSAQMVLLSRITTFYVMGVVGHMTKWLLQKQNSIVTHVVDECPP